MNLSNHKGKSSYYIYDLVTEQQTVKLAEQMAKLVFPGAFIALDGALGVGKTRFAQAFGSALGVKKVINSPTFTIIKEYEGSTYPFYHMDVYRLSLEEADELGLEEYFLGEGVTLVEWGHFIEPLFPAEYIHLQMERTGGQSRKLEITTCGRRYETWAKVLKFAKKNEI